MTGEAVELVVVGAGGFGHEVLQYARDAAAAGRLGLRVKGFRDDRHAAAGRTPHGEPVLGGTEGIEALPGERFVVAVGDPADRRMLAGRIAAAGGACVAIVHPTAYVAPTAAIGPGSVVCPFAFVGPHAQVGAHVVVNTHASVGHDVQVGDFATICPHAAVNGEASIGPGVFLGSGSVVTPKRVIGDGAVVAAGSVVYQDMPAGGFALGNPARIRALPASGSPGALAPDGVRR